MTLPSRYLRPDTSPLALLKASFLPLPSSSFMCFPQSTKLHSSDPGATQYHQSLKLQNSLREHTPSPPSSHTISSLSHSSSHHSTMSLPNWLCCRCTSRVMHINTDYCSYCSHLRCPQCLVERPRSGCGREKLAKMESNSRKILPANSEGLDSEGKNR